MEGIVANSPEREKIPRLTGRSCGEFPGIGRTLPSRHWLRIALLSEHGFRDGEQVGRAALWDLAMDLERLSKLRR